ncbi:MAG: beta-Ala-His dipeptidase [Clostridia bacterium]|nr:beta-Ala-His dipeptidase [Clostridia bacterium]
MAQIISGVKNEAPFSYFEEISKIPRGSRNESGITDYICEFAVVHGFEYLRDKENNVLIVKNATQGRENEDSILLQAHTDMVCEKNKDCPHNFLSDPIELIREGNILRANGTTLGADDGFGVAIMLAILSDDSFSHPRIECLFTSGEEIGLVGASKFDYTKIRSHRMINLDSAEENTIIIGCCGGIRTRLSCPAVPESGNFSGYKLTVTGLFGGHSGEDIDRGRQNSNVLMGKLLSFLSERTDIRVSSIDGGDRDNAIPRECEATVISSTPIDGLLDDARSYIMSLITADEDKNLTLKAEKTNTSSAFSLKDTQKLIYALSVPNGVLQYRSEEPILPAISRNLARVSTEDTGFYIGFSSRSYSENDLMGCVAELDSLAYDIGGSTYHHEKYPGWESPKESTLVKDYIHAYKSVIGSLPKITLIHAGLECGIITGSCPDMEAISVGCNVHDLHTPGETMEIDSMDRMYDIIVGFLHGENI